MNIPGCGRAPRLGAAVAALSFAIGLLAIPGAAFALPWQPGDVLTYDEVSWADDPTAAALLTTHYDDVYASTSDVFAVGVPGSGGFSLSFGDPQHVLDFLPQAGASGPLTQSQTNPSSSEAGLFGGDVVALKLDVDFSDAGFLLGSSGIPFGNLILNNFLAASSDADLNGLTVRQFLADDNTALGGGPSLKPIDIMNLITEELTISFDKGTVSQFAQDYLMAPSTPVSALPEPSSWVLFGTGLLAFAATLRWRGRRTV